MAEKDFKAALQAFTDLFEIQSLYSGVIDERLRNFQLNLSFMKGYLNATGLTLDDIDQLKVVHVSGTKGKGSTCVMLESILRRRGLKTGFFSSPHLLAPLERIRINGHPISEEKFAKHFWPVYESMKAKNSTYPEGDEDRMLFFKVITVLAFHIFLHEKVDVAIFEVGLGGRFDCTNIVRNPVACGITTLDLDHTSLLGNTIEKIAWHKAGIMKPGVPAFTDATQSEEAMRVLMEEADLVGCQLETVPDLSSYDWGPFPKEALGMYRSQANRNNASLALQLARCFVSKVIQPEGHPADNQDNGAALPTCQGSIADAFRLEMEEALGLRLCFWPGRNHVVEMNSRSDGARITYFFDGAHTPKSIENCKTWFEDCQANAEIEAENVDNGAQVPNDVRRSQRVLIFNTSGDRDSGAFLKILSSIDFDLVLFPTNLPKLLEPLQAPSSDPCPAQEASHLAKQLEVCNENLATWLGLLDGRQSTIANGAAPKAMVAPSIQEAVRIAEAAILGGAGGVPEENGNGVHVSSESRRKSVLVTGSLILVGAVMKELGFTANSTEMSLDLCTHKESQKIYDEYQKLQG